MATLKIFKFVSDIFHIMWFLHRNWLLMLYYLLVWKFPTKHVKETGLPIYYQHFTMYQWGLQVMFPSACSIILQGYENKISYTLEDGHVSRNMQWKTVKTNTLTLHADGNITCKTHGTIQCSRMLKYGIVSLCMPVIRRCAFYCLHKCERSIEAAVLHDGQKQSSLHYPSDQWMPMWIRELENVDMVAKISDRRGNDKEGGVCIVSAVFSGYGLRKQVSNLKRYEQHSCSDGI
jgi:hypothetical protein